MPYALSGLEDGREPSFRAISDPRDATADEVVVRDFPGGKVWDAVAQALREPTEAERLEAQKPQKIQEIHTAALDELAPLFTDEHGKDELIFLLAAHVRAILGAQADPRLGKVEEVGKKALAKRDEVQSAQSLEELEAVEWT